MENLKVRLINIEDIEEASKLVIENYASTKDGSNNFVIDMYTVENLKSRIELKIESAYVAEINNKIVGMISFFQAGDVATITLVLVKKEFECKGIGSCLLQTVLSDLVNVKKFIAHTEHTNKSSMLMFVKSGFVPEGFIHHGYGQDVHMISWGFFRNEIPTP